MLHQNVAEGVHRIEDSYVNWYLLEDDGRVTVVDAGMPSSPGGGGYSNLGVPCRPRGVVAISGKGRHTLLSTSNLHRTRGLHEASGRAA